MHHFISYSSADGQQIALQLADALDAGPPQFPTWLDKRRLQPNDDWDSQIDRAIRSCDSLIFVMTPDSVEVASVCKDEWVRALKFKKPLVLVRAYRDTELPFRLDSRQFIDLSNNFDSGLAQLRRYLGRLKTDEGQLHVLNERLADANRDLRRAGEPDQPRIEREIKELKEQIASLESVVRDPAAAAERARQSIETRMEAQRQPERPVSGRTRTKFINPPPMVAPSYFQNRFVETQLIANFLRDDALRMMTLVGRGGVGKTAMVCRLLRALESGRLPDDLGSLALDGIVYLSEVGSHTVNVANLYADLCRLLPDEQAGRLETLYREAKTPTRDKFLALLEHFRGCPVVVLLDNLEHLLDLGTRKLTDDELDEALRAVLDAPHHAVKLLITTRVPLAELPLAQPQRQRSLPLDEGLESPHAEKVLRELDADGVIGLNAADDQVLGDVRQRTRGFPRALEAFYGILSADRSTTLEELLSRAEHAIPETVVETLVGEAFSRLDRTAQLVMQSLAIFVRPVPPVAVDYLLQPHAPATDATAVLNRLVNMHFVRKEQGRYYLHPIDQSYALSQLPDVTAEPFSSRLRTPGRPQTDTSGQPAVETSSAQPPTRTALRHRAADFFHQTRLPRSDWKQLSDLEPQLSEFDLRCAAQDYDAAADVLIGIDYNYLLLWGHAQLLVSLRERLLDRLSDKRSTQNNCSALGSAYGFLGQVAKAIEFDEQALAIAREIGDRRREGSALGNLGVVHLALGQVTKAIQYCEQSLAIKREIGDGFREWAPLSNLGVAYLALGQVDKAIEAYEQSLAIARDSRDLRGEGEGLADLGFAYSHLGDEAKAIALCQQSQAICREIGYRFYESIGYSYIGHARLKEGEILKAIDEFQAAEHIAVETGIAQCEARAQMGLAAAFLLLGQLESSASAAQAARKADFKKYLPTILALQGIIAIRLEDRTGAREFFADSIRRADELLAQTPEFFAMLDAKGLALSGLVLSEQASGDGAHHAAAAIETYRAARAITSAAGIIQDALLLFDALAAADTDNLLTRIRPAIGSAEGV